MAPFELAEPRSLSDAFSLLQDDGARPMSGGTALMLMMKAGVLRPTRLVSLRRLSLAGVHRETGGLRVGAMTTMRELEKSAAVREGWPVITRTLRTLANVRVRNVATVGGALSHGDPHMDLPPLLSALGATVTIAGARGERTASVESLYAGYLETTLKPGELITEVRIPALGSRRAAYLKCTTRSADDWPALGIAVVLDAQKREASIVVSAATDRPTRLSQVETLFKGKDIDEKLLSQAAEAARSIDIEGDLHGSAAYKKHLIGVYLKRAVNEARNAGH
jgi:aerobic carbon-monoxide dehydrogenase medium subunit